ncbi:kinetochore Sim4 complex subunit Fta4 [Kalaharituber pfeilii]|nr:kinetochore Sim4 complex subunit Fta4 [Kalaharituber pfeilii]
MTNPPPPPQLPHPPATPSTFHLKKTFLDSQIRLLNTELRPPANWQDEFPASKDGDLGPKVVEMVLSKLNLVARKHNRAVYSAQACRGVAEQIETLYRASMDEAGASAAAVEKGAGMEALRRGADLADVDIIELLPDSFPGPGAPEDLERYKSLLSRLQQASTTLQAQRRRHQYYLSLHESLKPFSRPQETVQPNLITKGSELDVEMERMRKLCLRLSKRGIGGGRGRGG